MYQRTLKRRETAINASIGGLAGRASNYRTASARDESSTGIYFLMVSELNGLFIEPAVRVLTAPISRLAIEQMSRAEALSVERAVLSRRQEFATGRLLARDGLARYFDVHGFDLINGSDRAPVWPHGIAGSLSHTDVRAWVALVRDSLGAVGIDGENRPGLDTDLWGLILHREETEYVRSVQTERQGRLALTMFSAKEALYKAQYSLTGKFMGFEDLHVSVNPDGTVRYVLRRAIGQFDAGHTIGGHWIDTGAEIVTTAWIPTAM